MVVDVSLAYLLKIVTAQELTETIQAMLGRDIPCASYRKDLQSGYYLKNVKLWIWRCTIKNLTHLAATKVRKAYGVDPADHALYQTLVDSEYHPKLLALSKTYKKSHTLKQFDRLLLSILDEITPYIKRFAYKKLNFITFGNEAIDQDDLHAELTCYALKGILTQYPKADNRLHLTNIAKGAVHNLGINLITTYTSKGRKALIANNDGTFSSVVASRDSTEGGQLHADGVSVGLAGDLLDSHADNSLDVMSVQTLTAEATGFKADILNLLSGNYCAEFSQFLGGNQKDNDEFFDDCLNRGKMGQYIGAMADYMDTTPYKIHCVMNEVRAAL